MEAIAMEVEGFWTLQFSGKVYGSGVAILLHGKVFGGESGYYYMGNYTVTEKLLKARVSVHNFDPAVLSGFGITGDFEMEVSVTLQSSDGSAQGTAMIAGQPQHSLGLRMTKRANI
jgi:T3SS negative regulator,GrlR